MKYSIKYSFSDLVDTCRIKKLLISFYKLRGIPLALVDLEGNILACNDGSGVTAGWQDICLNFHRKYSETLMKCIESNIQLSNGLKAGKKYSCHTCYNGLVDMAVPIYIGDEHMANLFTGQFFFKPPNIEFFRENARKYCFNEDEYLNALSKVPVFSAKLVKKDIEFLTELAGVIGEMGLEKKKLLDSKHALQEIEERYNVISQNIGDVIWLLDVNSFRFTYVSPSSSSLCGYTPEEILKMTPRDILTPDSYKLIENKLFQRISVILSGDETARVMPCQVNQIHKNGDIIPTEMVTTLLINKKGQVDTILGISRDITEHKKTENMLQFQANILNNVRDCVIVHDLQGKIIYWNKGAEDIYGYLEEEIIGRNIKKLYLNTDKGQFTQNLKEIMESGEYNGEWEGKRKDGSKVYVDIRETAMHNLDGEIIGVIGVSKDITGRKEAEKALRDSEKQFRMITDNMVDMVSQTDINGVIQYVSPSGKTLLGYEPEELMGKTIFDHVHPDDLDKVKKNFTMAFIRMEPGRMEVRFRHADGHYVWLEIVGNLLFDEKHSIKGAVFGGRDINERKKVEKQIKRSEAYYRTIFENTGNATIIVEEDTTISLVNAEFEKLYGFSKEEVEGKQSWRKFAAQDYIQKMEAYHNLRRIDPNLAPRNYEFQFIDRFGKVKDVFTTVAMIPGTNKSVISLLDVTDKKMAKKALLESEAQLKMAMDLAKLAQWEYDVESDIFTFDDQFYKLYGTTIEKEGPHMSSEEYARKFIPPEEHSVVFEENIKILETDDPDYSGHVEHSIIRADGERRFITVHYEVIRNEEGRPIKTYGTNQDITEIKTAENKIKESLMEKEVLLKEIHHRVKNNLQIISSLLNLQTRYVEGEETINILKESQNRVKTMAIVHEKLYQSANLKDIDLKEYIENLVSDLFYSYGVKRGTIDLQIHVENLKMDIDTAIPCGLIINELVTNSLKYAFPPAYGSEFKNKGIIKIELKRLQDKLELIAADNGRGLPEYVDMENVETLGLKMVNILTNQLGGTLKLDRAGGTEFRIIFNELNYENRI